MKRFLRISPLTVVLAAVLLAGIAIAATPALRVNALDMPDGTGLALSATGHGVIKYDNASHSFQASTNGGAFASIGGGASLTNTRTADGAIDQYALIKGSTTAGRVLMLGAGDSPLLAVGVALTAAGGAGTSMTTQEVQGVQSKMLSDGTTTIAAGDLVQPSTTVAGRIQKGSTNSVGTAMSACAATLDCQVDVL